MTDLSPERLEKLLVDFEAAPMAPELHSNLHQLAPDLARQRIADAKRIAELEANYNELLYGVSMKHEGESRHETALRYILRAEAKSGDQCTNSQEPTQ